MTMKVLTAAALVALGLGLVVADAERSYTDDKGVIHTTEVDKPTIVTFAHTAVSFFDYGLTTDQLVGTYGEYVVDGSDFDFKNPEQASTYTADPEPEDLAKLQTVTNLSPECATVPGYCTSFNISTLLEVDPDFLIVHGYAHNPWGFSNFTEIELAFPTAKIIYTDVSLEGDNCGVYENCYGKSMIDIVEQYRELAIFLNLEEPAKLEEDLLAMCEAATEFSDHMEVAHEKGIRTMAAYVDPSNAFYASPVNDMVLRMFEELGMPILHVGACDNCSLSYFWETIPSGSYFASCSEAQKNATAFSECNDDPLYPVDVWLYDHRVKATINNEDFAVVFPDKAILEGQFVEWPIGGRKITPAHAVEILNSVGPAVAGFSRLHDETVCVADVDVSSTEHRQSGEGIKGAGAGEYACYNPDYHNMKYFKGCASNEEGNAATANKPAEDMADSSAKEDAASTEEPPKDTGNAATTEEPAKDTGNAATAEKPAEDKEDTSAKEDAATTKEQPVSPATGRHGTGGMAIAILFTILLC